MKIKRLLKSIGVVAAIGLAVLVAKAQPTPGIVDLGTPGQGVIYTGSHRVGPGSSGSNSVTIVNVVTQQVDYITVFTNTVITITTNVQFTQNINVSGKATFNQIILTNGFFSKTNLWSGPTNTLDMSIYRQAYKTVTPVSISGLINYSNNLASEVQLSIWNASTTNVTLTYVAGIIDRDHVTQQTITNGTKAIVWVQYDPAFGPGTGPETNSVFNDF